MPVCSTTESLQQSALRPPPAAWPQHKQRSLECVFASFDPSNSSKTKQFLNSGPAHGVGERAVWVHFCAKGERRGQQDPPGAGTAVPARRKRPAHQINRLGNAAIARRRGTCLSPRYGDRSRRAYTGTVLRTLVRRPCYALCARPRRQNAASKNGDRQEWIFFPFGLSNFLKRYALLDTTRPAIYGWQKAGVYISHDLQRSAQRNKTGRRIANRFVLFVKCLYAERQIFNSSRCCRS